MSLSSRLSLALSLLTAVVVVAFGAFAYVGFVRQQDAESRRLLAEDLTRVAALLERPTLGASFADAAGSEFAVQLVDADGATIVAWGAPEPLPLVEAPEPTLVAGRLQLVGSVPWRDAGATIRVAHDLSAAMATRRGLARSLTVGGALTFLLASGVAAVATRRALVPLERVADAARGVAAANPEPIAYDGTVSEVRALADALNHTLGAIAERQRAERAFLLEIAHELAGPLTLVHFHVTDLRRRTPDEPHLRAAAGAAQELLRTSQDLLVLARGELERPLDHHVVALRDLLDQATAEYPGVGVAADGRGEVVGDRDRLMQVVRNLVRNGIQAAGRPEGVHLELASAGAEMVLRVVDDGPGLDPETARRVFERGFRRGTGTGVGLTIARDLVLQHGGALTADARPEGGAVFELRLPALGARLVDGGEAARGS